MKELGDVEQIQLSVTSHNTVAKTMYEDMGFLQYGYEKNALKWQGNYYHEVHMVLHIHNT